MRLGFVVNGDIETRTGGFRYDRRLIATLRQRGATVEVVELPWRSYASGLVAGAAGRPVARVGQSIEGPVDVLLQDELAHPSLVGCNGRLRDRLEAPLVSVVHHLRSSEPGFFPANLCYRGIERRYLSGIDGVIATSQATRTAIRALASPPCVVAPPAADRFEPDVDDRSLERRAREGPLRLVFVGSVVPRKGVDTLVQALASLESAGSQAAGATVDADGHAGVGNLTFVGSLEADPAFVSRVRKQAHRQGVADRVTFAGPLPDEEVATVLRESHVLAMPSRYEGYGIAYLEGMAFGLPAIATTAGGASEIVRHGETGFLVEPDDPEAVASAIRTLAEDRDRLARMGRAARQRFDSQPDWADVATRVEEFLDGRLHDATESGAENAGGGAEDDGSGAEDDGSGAEDDGSGAEDDGSGAENAGSGRDLRERNGGTGKPVDGGPDRTR